jgi:hypothetical protein
MHHHQKLIAEVRIFTVLGTAPDTAPTAIAIV